MPNPSIAVRARDLLALAGLIVALSAAGTASAGEFAPNSDPWSDPVETFPPTPAWPDPVDDDVCDDTADCAGTGFSCCDIPDQSNPGDGTDTPEGPPDLFPCAGVGCRSRPGMGVPPGGSDPPPDACQGISCSSWPGPDPTGGLPGSGSPGDEEEEQCRPPYQVGGGGGIAPLIPCGSRPTPPVRTPGWTGGSGGAQGGPDIGDDPDEDTFAGFSGGEDYSCCSKDFPRFGKVHGKWACHRIERAPADEPIDLRTGMKIDAVVDLSVPLRGRRFVFTRRYTGESSHWRGSGLIGHQWNSDQFTQLIVTYNQSDEPTKVELLQGFDRYTFLYDGVSGQWVGPSAGRLTLHDVDDNTISRSCHVVIDSSGSYVSNVWKLEMPSGEIRYYAENHNGSTLYAYCPLFRVADELDNRLDYHYIIDPTSESNWLPTRITASSPSPSGGRRTDAMIRYQWKVDTAGTRLGGIDVLRPLSSDGAVRGWVMGEQVRYTYKADDDASFSDDLGSGLDLVQVEYIEPVNFLDDEDLDDHLDAVTITDDDDPNAPPYESSDVHNPKTVISYPAGEPLRRRYVQYRYYGPQDANGAEHLLRAEIGPLQIEHYLRRNHDLSGAVTAADLLELDDADPAIGLPDSLDAEDLFAKLITYNGDNSVATQIIRAGCSCGGDPGHQRELHYAYSTFIPNPTDSPTGLRKTVQITEKLNDGVTTPTPTNRVFYYDMVSPEGSANAETFVLHRVAVVDPSDTDDAWVTEYHYGEDYLVDEIVYPSSVTTYTRTDQSSLPSVVYNESPGNDRREFIEYDAAGRQQYFATANGSGTEANKSYHTKYTYDSHGRITKVERARVLTVNSVDDFENAISTSPDDIETTWIDYGHFTDWASTPYSYDPDLPVRAIRFRHERELTTENGPGTYSGGGLAPGSPHTSGAYASYRFLDEMGRVDCELSPDGSGAVYYYWTNEPTGQLRKVEYGAIGDITLPYGTCYTFDDATQDGETICTDVFGGDYTLSDWPIARESAGVLIYEFGYDRLGRLTDVLDPEGRATATRRVIRTDHPDSSYDTFAIVEVPTYAVTNFAGPSSIIYADAIGQVTATRAYTAASITYVGGVPSFDDLGDSGTVEVGRTVNERDRTGRVTRTRVYHTLGLSPASYDTEYTYDDAGRVASVEDPTGTITQLSYDVLNRVTAVAVGTTSETPVTVAEYYYDGFLANHGFGNGNLTYVRQHIDGTRYRDTGYFYNFRDRMTRQFASYYDGSTTQSVYPQTALEYDNLGRVVGRAVYEGPIQTDPTTYRAAYIALRYSQRGMLYRKEMLRDPLTDIHSSYTYSASDWILSNYWYDPAGRLIALQEPDAPRSMYVYDTLDRVIKAYATDGAANQHNGVPYVLDATDPAAVYRDAAEIANHLVLEQTEYTFEIDTVSSPYRASNELIVATGRSLTDGEQAANLATGDLDLSSGLSATGLASTDVITTYTGYIYDDLGRLVHEVDFGTNRADTNADFNLLVSGGTAPSVNSLSSLSHSWIDDEEALVSSIVYNDRGLVQDLIDPTQNLDNPPTATTRFFYDPMGRVVATVENFETGSGITEMTLAAPGGGTAYWHIGGFGSNASDASKDRATLYTYDSAGRLQYIVAATTDAGTPDYQVTQYVYGPTYGTGAAQTRVPSNQLLAKIHYPDESTGEPNTAASGTVQFAYNRLGEVRFALDQRGVSHTLTRDGAGRVLIDDAGDSTGPSGSLPSGVDSTVDRQVYAYNDVGQLEFARTYDGSSSVLSAVKFVYDGDQHHLTKLVQNPTGDVGVSATDEKTLEYVYDTNTTTASGVPRLDSIDYPTGSFVVDVLYGTEASNAELDDVISRMTALQWEGYGVSGGNYHSVAYAYLGIAAPVLKDFAHLSLGLDFRADPNATSPTAGTYHAIDRFGRPTRTRWIDDGFNPASKVELIDWDYVYDWSLNNLVESSRIDRRGSENTTYTDHVKLDDEVYAYDGLYRLTEAKKGTESTFSGTPVYASGSRQWDYDHLGNWNESRVDLTDSSGVGDGDYTDADETGPRRHNMANELTDIDYDDDTTFELQLTFDNAGNMVSREIHVGGGSISTWQYTYDAWNRMVSASVTPSGQSPQLRAIFSYNALDQRATREADTSDPPDEDLNERTRFYYDAGWRIIEEHTDEWSSGTGTWDLTGVLQRVYGPVGADEMLFYQRDTDADASMDDGFYALHDLNGNVVMLLSHAAAIKEKYYYSPYGTVRAVPYINGDINEDGIVNIYDWSWIANKSGTVMGQDAAYSALGDFDRDGDIDVFDTGVVQGAFGYSAPAAPAGAISAFGNTIGYAGYVWEPNLGGGDSGMYQVRFRWYVPELGRWGSEDPLGYFDGLNQYWYCHNSPMVFADPGGLHPGILGGALIGAGFGAVSSGVTSLVTGGHFWRDVAAGAAGGAVVGGLAGGTLGVSLFWAGLSGGTVAAFVGETWDWIAGRGFSWRDAAWTIGGSCLVSVGAGKIGGTAREPTEALTEYLAAYLLGSWQTTVQNGVPGWNPPPQRRRPPAAPSPRPPVPSKPAPSGLPKP